MKIVFVIIGTIIGAGFASGQEINSFFVRYGIYGFLGIIFSSIMLSLIIYKTLKTIKKNNVNTYTYFLVKILGDKFSEKDLFKNSIVYIVNIFLLISFYIMISGFSVYFYQELNLPKIIGWFIIFFLLLFAFSKNISGIINVNNYLIPILIILFIVLGIKKINLLNFFNIEKLKIFAFVFDLNFHLKWIISSILYASYNSIVLIPVLINLKKYITNEKKISIISGMIFAILGLIIYLILNSSINVINNVEIPVVFIAGSLGNIYKLICGIVILIAIFTSCISSGYGFLVNVSKNKKMYNIISFVIIFSSLFFVYIGFSNLINLLYPIFGIIGLIQIFFLLKT